MMIYNWLYPITLVSAGFWILEILNYAYWQDNELVRWFCWLAMVAAAFGSYVWADALDKLLPQKGYPREAKWLALVAAILGAIGLTICAMRGNIYLWTIPYGLGLACLAGVILRRPADEKKAVEER